MDVGESRNTAWGLAQCARSIVISTFNTR